MFDLIILIILYFIFKKYFLQNNNSINSKLNTLFEVQHFSNISKETLSNGISLIYANTHGENYLFALKNNSSYFSISDIIFLYEKAQKDHIHNVVVLLNSSNNSILNKAKEYNIQIWDNKKLDSLISLSKTTNILQTSDTSDDTCKIDTNSFEPIQEPNSFFKNLFKKPNRL